MSAEIELEQTAPKGTTAPQPTTFDPTSSASTTARLGSGIDIDKGHSDVTTSALTEPGIPASTTERSNNLQEALPPIPRRGLLTLLAQHISRYESIHSNCLYVKSDTTTIFLSSWNARSCEFAFYLFLIELFPNTLVRSNSNLSSHTVL